MNASNLGPCCSCGVRGPAVRTVIVLPYRAPAPGIGWGCAICHLPSAGAVAVLCDACVETPVPGREFVVCAGYPSEGRRVDISATLTLFDHVHTLHEETDNGAPEDDDAPL